MIRVDFDPGALRDEQATWWKAWEAKARAATAAAKEFVIAKKPIDFRTSVWKELKEWLFENVFFEKCAYCEGKVTPQSFGDAEHWRPKAAVKRWQGGSLQPVEVDGKKHPGYWWLAYHWSNLLPACEKCNSGKGKGNQFPIGGTYVCEPSEAGSVDEIDACEVPLLLHPFRGEDPADHLGFDELGQIYPIAKSLLGDASIKVFDLDRDKLTEDRYSHLHKAEDRFLKAAVMAMVSDCAFSEALDGLCHESSEYSAATKHHAMRWLDSVVGKMRA